MVSYEVFSIGLMGLILGGLASLLHLRQINSAGRMLPPIGLRSSRMLDNDWGQL